MTDARTAMQQALKALDSCDGNEGYMGPQQWFAAAKVRDAEAALRAALAAPQPEPVAWLYRWKGRTSSEQLSRARWPESDLWIEVPLFESTPPDTEALITEMLEALEAMQSYAAAERKGLLICDEAIAAARKHKGLA